MAASNLRCADIYFHAEFGEAVVNAFSYHRSNGRRCYRLPPLVIRPMTFRDANGYRLSTLKAGKLR